MMNADPAQVFNPSPDATLPGATREALQQRLDAELSAPMEQMNTALVAQLLNALEDGATLQEQQLAWQRLAAALHSTPGHKPAE